MNKETVQAVAPIVMPVVIGAVALIVIFYVIHQFTGGIKSASEGLGFSDNDQTKEAEKNVTGGVKTDPKIILSYPLNNYNDVAEKLYQSVKGVGTDTGQVTSVVKWVKNQNDWNQLIKSFGIRDGENMLTWIRGEFSQSKNKALQYGATILSYGLIPLDNYSSLDDLNNILRSKKITQYLL